MLSRVRVNRYKLTEVIYVIAIFSEVGTLIHCTLQYVVVLLSMASVSGYFIGFAIRLFRHRYSFHAHVVHSRPEIANPLRDDAKQPTLNCSTLSLFPFLPPDRLSMASNHGRRTRSNFYISSAAGAFNDRMKVRDSSLLVVTRAPPDRWRYRP